MLTKWKTIRRVYDIASIFWWKREYSQCSLYWLSCDGAICSMMAGLMETKSARRMIIRYRRRVNHAGVCFFCAVRREGT